MEFVLVTTTSTPDTSRSGSVMKFGDYREDEQRDDEAAALPLEKEFLQFDIDSDDEDTALLEAFNVLSARHRLVAHDFCTKLTLDHDQQKGLQLEVGLHISEENPWKQVRKEILLDYLPDDEAAPPQFAEFRLKLLELESDSLVLVGFAAAITDDIEDTDTYLFYADPESAKESVGLIQRLEAFERQRVNRTIYKYPKPWQSLGSELEVDLQVEAKQKDRVEVEIQRLKPSNKTPEKLSFRFAEDVRDGYVELVPKHKNIDVVMRSTVSVAVQSAAQRIESEQQTEPTFPANQWSQYSYELPLEPGEPEENFEENDETEANESCDEDEESEKVKDVIGPSDAMKELLRVLEFNAIDMYRDDYEQIATNAIKRFARPVITEVFCFIDPLRCANRFVNAFAWHPTLSGVFVASYTFKALNTFSRDEKISEAEMNKKSVMSANPVLLWSFDDTLYPKLVLETPREVTYLSFCPYDANVLIGGLITGQLIIWDLKNCLHRVEHPAELTDKQEKNRKKMHSFMTWSNFVENLQQNVIQPAAISHYDLSHKKLVTSIKWLNRKHDIASTGLIQESIKPNEQFRQFVTSSLDGTVLFWDLDFISSDIAPKEMKKSDTKRKLSIRAVPEEFVSPYEKLNGVFCPNYAAACEQPISSLIFDEGLFRYEPKNKVENSQIEKRIEFNVIQEQQEKPSNRLVISSLISGSISTFIWEGFLYKEGKPEKAKQIESYGIVHNGPILLIERNPFMNSVILSVGQKVLAIWSENNQSTPILWRRRETNITCAQWSPTRVSLFFIARYDGIIELWDLLTRSDDACISHDAGTSLITVITQHKLSLLTDILMIADQKANLRAFTLPSLSRPKDNDLDRFKQLIEHESKRKEKFSEWQQSFVEKNEDLAEPKQLLREESRRTMLTETLTPQPTDANIKGEKRRSSIGTRSKSIVKQVKSKCAFDFSERLHKKWEEMMVKRLVKTMITLKQFDLERMAIEIQPEKDRLAYNAEKKRSIEEVFRKMQIEVSEIRARLMPPKDVDQEADRLNFINSSVDNMLAMTEDGFKYDAIKTELKRKVDISKCESVEINWHELLYRAQQMRSERSKAIFEKRRKAYVGKSAQIDTKAEE